jgi:hypothetical protein
MVFFFLICFFALLAPAQFVMSTPMLLFDGDNPTIPEINAILISQMAYVSFCFFLFFWQNQSSDAFWLCAGSIHDVEAVDKTSGCKSLLD